MSGDGDKRRETASRLRPGRESVGLGPRTPRSVPRPAWHPPASTQAPGWSGPARRAKVAAKTAPPLARRRCLRLGAVGRGGGAVCPSVRGRDAGLSTWAGTRGADGGQALGPRRLRAALPRTGAMDRFPFSGPRLLPRHGPVGTRGLAFWGPGKWKSEPTSVKEGVQAFKEFGHDHKFRRHGEALTLLLGPQGWDGGGGGIRAWRRACVLKEEAVVRSSSGADRVPLFSLGEFSCSESEEGERAAVGVFSAWETCFWCLEESGPKRLCGVRVSPSLGNRSVSR